MLVNTNRDALAASTVITSAEVGVNRKQSLDRPFKLLLFLADSHKRGFMALCTVRGTHGAHGSTQFSSGDPLDVSSTNSRTVSRQTGDWRSALDRHLRSVITHH